MLLPLPGMKKEEGAGMEEETNGLKYFLLGSSPLLLFQVRKWEGQWPGDEQAEVSKAVTFHDCLCQSHG